MQSVCDMQEEASDIEGVSDSGQDSVSEDESAVKPHRRSAKSALPARSLTSQHSDVASQLGQPDHQLCTCPLSFLLDMSHAFKTFHCSNHLQCQPKPQT